MEFGFKIKNDLLVPAGIFRAVTGNVNSYTCHFEIEAPTDELLWLCVFRQGDAAYQQVIENGKCVIPQEVLEKAEPVHVGCYATKENGNFVRISTNWVPIGVSEGAYLEATAPKIPTPDVWEELLFKKLPYIGDNGNWFFYQPNTAEYADSGVPAKGYTPQKGVDYWTDDDIARLEADIAKGLLAGMTFSVTENGIVTVSKED